MDALRPAFVVLHHRMPRESPRASHFDLMLERGATLQSWALECWPLPPGRGVEALELAPHRRAYLTYEGPVSGDRGEVRRVAAGRYRRLEQTDQRLELQLEAGDACWTVRLERQAADAQRWWVTLVTAEAVRKS